MLTKMIDYNIQQEVKNMSKKEKYKPGFFIDNERRRKQKEQDSEIVNILMWISISIIAIFFLGIYIILQII